VVVRTRQKLKRDRRAVRNALGRAAEKFIDRPGVVARLIGHLLFDRIAIGNAAKTAVLRHIPPNFFGRLAGRVICQ
jgi:hypothetical protein